MAGKKASPGEIGHNSGATTPLTDDEMHALTLQHKKKYETALAKKKTADADFKNICKVLKSELGDHGLADIKDMIAAENDEDFEEKMQAQLERQARLARWLGLDIGETADLFSDIGTTTASVAERAYADGKRAGMAGEICKPTFETGEAHNEYVKGWHEGQGVLASQIKKKEAVEVPLIVNPDRAESGVDEFDEAATGGDDGDGADEVGDADTTDEVKWPDDAQVAAREPAETV